MIKFLSKTRSPNYYSTMTKLLLLALIGVLLYNSPQARQFTADTLRDAAEIVEPNEKVLFQFTHKKRLNDN